MANALSKLKSMINEEGADGGKRITPEHQRKAESQKVGKVSTISSNAAVPLEEVIEENLHVIHENQPRVYDQGYSMEILANEFALILHNEMVRVGISSVSSDVFGVFHTLGIRVKLFKVVEDLNTGKIFYVIRKYDRTAEIKKMLLELARKHKNEVISLNYLSEVRLNIPLNLKLNVEEKSVKRQELMVQSLTVTAEEAASMKYAFIKKISHYDHEGNHLLLINFDLDSLEVSEHTL